MPTPRSGGTAGYLADSAHRALRFELQNQVQFNTRAQRQAGNKTATLLRLMSQYQSQNQTDLAVQIARQILRKGPSINPNYRGGMDEAKIDDVAIDLRIHDHLIVGRGAYVSLAEKGLI